MAKGGDVPFRRHERGRPPLSPEMLRRHRVTVALSDDERSRIDRARPVEMSLTVFIREAALARKPAIPAVAINAMHDLGRLAGTFERALAELRDFDRAEIESLRGLCLQLSAEISGARS